MQKQNGFNGKKIVLGVCSSIAAYKACEIVSALVRAGAQVRVVMTENACKLVSPRVFRTLSRNPVAVSMWTEVADWKPEHIALAEWGDILLVAPATANAIGNFANGLASDFLSTLYLAFPKKTLIAPAMNCHMLENKAVRRNIATLKADGAEFVEPEEGALACGCEGKGRLASAEKILETLQKALEQ